LAGLFGIPVPAGDLQFDSWPQIVVVDPKKALDKKRAPEIA